MPWDCCDATLLDSVPACPACGKTKAAWTVELEKTRTLVFARGKPPKKQKLELLTGVDPLLCQPAEGPPVHSTRAATFAPVLLAGLAADYARLGSFPPPTFLLSLRVWPGDAPAAVVAVTLTFAEGEQRAFELEVPAAGKDGWRDVPLLLVWQDEGPLTFPGTLVVDVSSGRDELTAPYAEKISFAAFGQPAIELECHEVLPALELAQEPEDA